MSAPDGAGLATWEGVPVATLEALWRVPRVEAWTTLGSTNDRARALADAGAQAFTVVLAEAQSAGRGRRGRAWHSPPGSGLWMSVVLRPAGGEAARRLLPLLMGLAAARAVETAAPGVRAGLKWPNDVQIGGRKVAGVLCEAAGGDAVVAGVGMNVMGSAHAFPPELRAVAVSVEEAWGAPPERAAVAGALVAEARRLVDPGVLRLEGELAREVEARDVLRGRAVRLEDGRAGVAAGLAPDGALLVEREGRTERVLGGSVRPA